MQEIEEGQSDLTHPTVRILTSIIHDASPVSIVSPPRGDGGGGRIDLGKQGLDMVCHAAAEGEGIFIIVVLASAPQTA